MTTFHLDVDVLGGDRVLAHSRVLFRVSRRLCDEAALLSRAARDARERSAAIRRSHQTPWIGGGAGDDNGPARRARIARKVATGELPSDTAPRLWGRPGGGETCDGCDERIDRAALAIESQSAVGRAMVFHAGCFHEWERECKMRERDGRGASRGAIDGQPAKTPGIVAALLEAFFARSPLCHACLVSASRAGAAECDRALERITAVLEVRRFDGMRCRACGQVADVFWLNAPPLRRAPRPEADPA